MRQPTCTDETGLTKENDVDDRHEFIVDDLIRELTKDSDETDLDWLDNFSIQQEDV